LVRYRKNIVKDKPLTVRTQGDSTVTGDFTTTNSYYTNASSHSNYYGNLHTTSPNGVTTTYSYDSNGNIASIKDANNKTTSYQWSHGTVSKITNAYYSINRSINWAGTVASETNGRGNTTSYLYDAAMRLTRTTPPAGNATVNSYEYDGSGYLVSIKEQRGSVYTRKNNDGLGRKTGSLNSLGVQTSTAYSACGLKQSVSSNIGDTTTFDNFERPTKIVHQDNQRILLQYVDDLHLKTTHEDNVVTHNYFRSFGSPDQTLTYRILDSKYQTTDYSYNILGSLRTATGLGRTDSYSYNSKNFLTGENHPESGTTSYGRDNVGNLKSITDSIGTRSYTYDDINRLLSITSTGGNLSYSYDKADNLTRSQSPNNVQTYGYDAVNRLTQTGITTQSITKNVGYSYDANDNLTRITYPNAMAVNYGYNSLNQVTSVNGFGADIHSVTYSTTGSKIGLMSQYVRSNGQVATFSYDNRRRPSRSTYPGTDLGYNFNARGNLANYYNYKDRTKDKSFGYDPLNRLTVFNGPWGNGIYQYDPSGDRTQKTIGSATTSYSYTNHLLTGSSYSFNGDGDMTRDGDVSFEYDVFHNVKKATKSGSTLATYGYDSSKQRVYKIAGDSTTLYFNDFRGNTLSELTGAGTPLENYVYLGDKLISKVSYNRAGDVLRDGTRDQTDTILALSVLVGKQPEKPLFLASDVNGNKKIGLEEAIFDLGIISGLNSESEVFFYDTDYLGTSVTLSSLSGNVVWQVDELPFGEEYEQDGISDINTRRYIGKEKDVETGLLYFGARYLKAEDGRFTSFDPVGLVDTNGKVNPDILSDPQRLNRYAYGLNNPYRYVDPDGEFAFAAVALVAAGTWAMDAMMPKSTDVSNSKGFLDHSYKATMVAPIGAGLKVTQLALRLPSTVKSAKGVSGVLRNTKFNYRIDTNKVVPGEGGFHIHLYRGKTEVAKISGKGGWVKRHEGNLLHKPSQVSKDIRQDINRLVKHTKKKNKKRD
jgi:RHS repeat-associated protein